MFIGVVVMIIFGFIVLFKIFFYFMGVVGLLFCYLIDIRFLIFMMGKVLVLFVMCFVIECWFVFIKFL